MSRCCGYRVYCVIGFGHDIPVCRGKDKTSRFKQKKGLYNFSCDDDDDDDSVFVSSSSPVNQHTLIFM